MFMLTREAADAIRRLTRDEAAGGIRIHAGSRRIGSGRFARDQTPPLQIEFARWPDVEDSVFEAGGARLYLEPESLRALDDKVLDAHVEDGEPRFAVVERARAAV